MGGVGARPFWASSGTVLLTRPNSRMGLGGTPPPAPAMLAFCHGHWSPLVEKGFPWKTSSFPCVIITHIETELPVRLLEGDGGARAASSVTGSVGFSLSRMSADPQAGLASCSPVVCGQVLLGSVLGAPFPAESDSLLLGSRSRWP